MTTTTTTTKKKKPTISIAVAGAIIDNAQSLELATLVCYSVRTPLIDLVSEALSLLLILLSYLPLFSTWKCHSLFPMHKSLKFAVRTDWY
ncbi:hypothetical protein BHE74_00028255 [Ensete ventricosum]|nr:hypothetical protein BHE74_00028255 [Ensete ventricosum]